MTRDIVALGEYIVLIESSHIGQNTVDLCQFNDDIIGIAFYGSGEVVFSAQVGGKETLREHSKGLALSFFANKEVFFQHQVSGDVPLQCVCICLSLKNLKKLPKQEQDLYHSYLGMLTDSSNDFIGGPGSLMSGDMMAAVDKIFSTNYTGAARQMFLQSKITELLSHFFAHLAQPETAPTDAAEIEKLYQAKDILIANIESPPSLSELSKQIGLNSFKLKKNFKEMFGLPVFKYLQNERLTLAHHLLSKEKLTTQEAAWKVGYESLSSFSNAFMKKYGFRPSQVQ